MSDDLNTEIKISANASGVESGVSKAKQSLASLGAAALQAGRDAAKGVGSIGEGGDKSARQVESATKSIVSGLQRQIAAFEAGGRGTRAYQESLARIRGVDVNALKPLLDQLDASKAKAQSAAQANVTLASSYSGLSSAALVAGRAIAAIGIGVSVREFIQMADASTNVASRLSLVTNSTADLATVQQRLFAIAQSSRVSFVDLASTYAQMARATKELGVSQKDMLAITQTISQAVTISGGSAQSAQAALIQLSQGFAAGALRGEELNSIMEQTPRLAQAIANGMGVGIGKLREMGKEGELTAEKVLGALQKSASGVEAEFARMTPTIEQSIVRITNSMVKLAGSFDGLLGATSKIAGAFGVITKALDFIGSDIDKINSQGPLREAAAQVLRLDQQATQLRNGMANGFYSKNTIEDLDRVNRKLETAKTRFNELHAAANGGGAAGDQSAFRSRSQSYDAEASRQSKLATDLNNVRLKLSGVPESYVKDMTEIIRLNQAGLLVGKEYTDALKKQQESLDKKGTSAAASAITAEQNAYESLISSIRTKIESERMELAGGNSLSESKKISIKLDQELASGKLKLSGAHKSVAAAAIEELAALERQKKVAASLKAYDAERAKIADELSAAAVAESKAREQGSQAVSDYAQAIDDQNRLTQYEIGLAGKTSTEREIAIRQYRVQLDLKKQIEAIDKNTGFDEDQRIAERARANTAAVKAMAGVESSVYLDEWKKTSEAIESSLTEALLRGFESGKGFAENFRDTVVSMFKTMVLRPTVQATVQGGMNAVGLGPQAGSQGGGLMGMASNANSLNSLWGAGSQALYGGAAGASTASLGYANAVGAVGGDGLGALIGANAQWAGVATGSAAAAKAAIAANLAMPAGTAVALPAGTLAASGTGAAAAGPLAAMGPVGWAALAAVAAYAIFGGKGGGPKTESGGGYGIGGYMNSGGPAVDYAKGVEATYAGLAKQLGLTGSLSVGAFTSQDKAGDSMTQVEVLAALNGQSIYGRGARLGGVENVGRSDEELQAALAEEATRVLFGALKASDLPEQYKAYLNTVADGAAAMQAAIEKVVGVKQFADALNKLPFDNLKNLAFDASDSLLTLSGGLESMLGSLKSYYELYYTDAERLAQSQATMTDALAKLGLALPQTKDGFRELVNGMDLTTESSRIAYMALLQLAPEFAATADGLSALAKTAAADLFKSFFDSAKINFAGLGDALASVDYSTFTETVALVFDNLAGRIKGVMDGIANERNAVADARLKILDPGVMSKDAILRGIADASISAPTNAALVAAQTSLGGVDADVAAKAASVARAKAIKPDTSALDSARTTFTNAQAVTGNASAWVDYMRAAEGGKFNWWVDEAMAGRQHDAGPSDSGENNAYRIVATYKAALEAQTAPQAAYEQALSAYSAALAVNAGKVAEAQAILTAATADQSAAVLVARQAQLDYIASLQDFAIDAGKSVTKLGKLREETLKYYEAQKQLADLMTNSAAGLRESVRVTRMGQLDSAQSLAQRQAEFQTNYSMALVTSGATQAGYADKLAAALPDLSVALMDTAGTREEWARATAALLAQSEAIAGKLEANTPTDYVAESLAMLTSIDTTLAALQESATSAEKIIADAVAAGSEKTAAGLRAVIAALTGQSVPAFAAGGYHGGGLRIVGENGPEIEASGPSRIWNANQTAAMLGGGGMAQELRALREEVRGLRAEAQATAGHTNKTARLLERAMPDGDALAVREAAV